MRRFEFMSLPDSSSDMCGFCGYKSFLIDYYVGIICVWGGKICVTAPSSVFTVLLHICVPFFFLSWFSSVMPMSNYPTLLWFCHVFSALYQQWNHTVWRNINSANSYGHISRKHIVKYIYKYNIQYSVFKIVHKTMKKMFLLI